MFLHHYYTEYGFDVVSYCECFTVTFISKKLFYKKKFQASRIIYSFVHI